MYNAGSAEEMGTVCDDWRLESIQTDSTLLIRARVKHHQDLLNQLTTKLISGSISCTGLGLGLGCNYTIDSTSATMYRASAMFIWPGQGVSEWILNGTSAQLGYTVPFTLVHAGKYRRKDK